MRNYGMGTGKDGFIKSSDLFASASEHLEPPNEKLYQEGVIPTQTYPAKHHNYFNNYYTGQWNEAALDMEDLYAELTVILTAAGMAPDKNTHGQVLNAIKDIIDIRIQDGIGNKMVDFIKSIQLKPITSGSSIKELFGTLSKWYDKLTEDDCSEYIASLTKAAYVEPLVSGERVRDHLGKMAKWYDMLLNPNTAKIDGYDKAVLFEPITPGDDLQTICSKLLKWFYVLADIEATGLIPVMETPPDSKPAEGYGYLWVDSILNRVRCRVMINGVMTEIPVGGGGGTNVERPLNPMRQMSKLFTDPWGSFVHGTDTPTQEYYPAGSDDEYVGGNENRYPTGPSEYYSGESRGGLEWIDPIDKNFSHIIVLDKDGSEFRVEKGIQRYIPTPGPHHFIVKAVDVDGYASEGLDYGDETYEADYNPQIESRRYDMNTDTLYVLFTRKVDMSSVAIGANVTGVEILEQTGYQEYAHYDDVTYAGLDPNYDWDTVSTNKCGVMFKFASKPFVSGLIFKVNANSAIKRLDGKPLVEYNCYYRITGI